MNTARNMADLVGRIYLVVLFLASGIGKIGAYAATTALMASHGVPGFLLPLVIFTEIGGSLLILFGWHTRVAAILMAGFTLLAIFLFHLHPAGSAERIVLLTELADAGGFLILAANGAQGWSVDALLARIRRKAAVVGLTAVVTGTPVGSQYPRASVEGVSESTQKRAA